VQVSELQVQQAAQIPYWAGRDCVQQSQTQLGKASCWQAEMEQQSAPVTEAIFYKQND